MPFGELADTNMDDFKRKCRESDGTWGFLHIPKTAGTSLLNELNTNRKPYYNIFVKDYNVSFANFQKSEWDVVNKFMEVQTHLEPARRFKSFSGHIKRKHAEVIRKQFPDVKFFTILRDPVDRVISEYNYSISDKHPTHKYVASKFPSVLQFAEHPINQNVMYNALSSPGVVSPENGIADIFGFLDFIGTIETYSASVSLFFSLMGVPHVPTIRLNTRSEAGRAGSEIEEEFRIKIRELNALDELLFRETSKLLAKHETEIEANLQETLETMSGKD